MFLSAFFVLYILGCTCRFLAQHWKRISNPTSRPLEITVTATLYLRLARQNSLERVLLSFPHRCMKCYPMSVILTVQHAGTGNTGMPTPRHRGWRGKAGLHYKEKKKICVCKRIFIWHLLPLPSMFSLQAVSVLLLKRCNYIHGRLDRTCFKHVSEDR